MIYAPIPDKQCTKCKQWIVASTEFFYKDARGRDGLFAHCKACHNAITQRRDIEHHELARERHRRWNAEHPEKMKESSKRWAANHREQVAEHSRRYYHAHKEERRAISKRWREE